MLILNFFFMVFPKHTGEDEKTCQSKDAILVVSDVDTSFDEEKSHCNQGWSHEGRVKVEIHSFLIIRCFHWCVVFTVVRCYIVEVIGVTDRRYRDC